MLNKYQYNNFSVIANQISTNARSIGLNLDYDIPTVGDGNCWYHAVIQQMRRPEVFQSLSNKRRFDNHLVLRDAVVAFIEKEERTNQWRGGRLKAGVARPKFAPSYQMAPL